MTVLIGIALKSLIVAALTLALLRLLKGRSAAERSWIAHIGLLALLIMAFAPLVLPRLTVDLPRLVTPAAVSSSITESSVAPAPLSSEAHEAIARHADASAIVANNSTVRTTAATALYALPAVILIIITFLALLRLFALRARADVLVDTHWLSALARAQRRMGFKHGTALLTSNELASPISWGLFRPVILLNSRAVEAADEAEAIIAHELAHVARMDWLKLLLARFATALFWFNPLVWLLAREAHQLREEAADDSVLASDITNIDYAQLLVGVARHECPGLLLGAHGVAPSKSSLARRVARVLDARTVRGPVARSFALCALAGALLVSAPLAAITLAPASTLAHSPSATPSQHKSSAMVGASTADDPADLPGLIAQGVSNSVSTAAAAIVPEAVEQQGSRLRVTAPNGTSFESSHGVDVARSADGSKVVLYPPDSRGDRRMVTIAANGARAIRYADREREDANAATVSHEESDGVIGAAMAMKAVGVTPAYVAAIRAASPAFRNGALSQILELKAAGVTPEYVRSIADAGFSNLNASQIEEARAVGMDAAYMRAVRDTGVAVTFAELVQLRTVGIRPGELSRMRPNRTLALRHRGIPAPPSPRRAQSPQRPSDDPDGG